MKLSRVNLNLLVVLNTLLEEKHITKTGQLLNLTQSTVSSSLKQLRELFNDKLLIREKNNMVLTAKAIRLHPKVKFILQQIQQNIFTDITFDPTQATNTFRMTISDYMECLLLPELKAYLKKNAPKIKIVTSHARSNYNQQSLSDNLPHLFLGDFLEANHHLHKEILYHEQLVCVSNEAHPLLQKPLCVASYLEGEHLLHTENSYEQMSLIDKELEKMGHKRNITMSVSHLSTAFYLLASSDYLITLPLTVVKKAQQLLKITYQQLPFEIACIPTYIAWHQKYHYDSAHIWFRGVVQKILTNTKLTPILNIA